jgi:hypothetical protein
VYCVDNCAIYPGELQVNTTKELPEARISTSIRLAGIAVRTLFLIILIVITARVASPQLERLRSLYETPSDLVRVALGLAVCVWLFANLFILPKDPGAYRTWLYLGFAVIPLSLLCAVAIW